MTVNCHDAVIDSKAIKVKENDVIVDIGAHFGLFTLESFALSNHTSKHYCFEPIPQIREKLEDTVSGKLGPNTPTRTHLCVSVCISLSLSVSLSVCVCVCVCVCVWGWVGDDMFAKTI